jgi:hypothetical protein
MYNQEVRMKIISVLFLSVFFASPSSAVEPTNNEVLKSVLAQIQQNYNLTCKEGREPGTILNPMICNPPFCQGTVKFRCYNNEKEKKFQVKATYLYGRNETELKKVTISILD